MTAMRSDIASASPVVGDVHERRPQLAWTASARAASVTSFMSSAPSGSSSNSAAGWLTSARARATRCWPPESCRGRRISSPSSSTMRRISSTRRRAAAWHALYLQPERDVVEIDMCGNSAYCWNTMLTGRRFEKTEVTSRPCRITRPPSGTSNPAIIRSVAASPPARAEEREELSFADRERYFVHGVRQIRSAC